jgi:hypothetical protein
MMERAKRQPAGGVAEAFVPYAHVFMGGNSLSKPRRQQLAKKVAKKDKEATANK